MTKYYRILVEEFFEDQLLDKWYLRDTIYPGILVFDNYQQALLVASKETFTMNNYYYKCTPVQENNSVGQK